MAEAAPAPSTAVAAGEWPLPWQEVAGPHDGARAHLEYVLARGGLEAMARLPHAAQRALVGMLGRVARRVDRRHARAAREFLETALGPGLTAERREQLVLASFRHLVRVTLEQVQFERRVVQDDFLAHFEVALCDDARRVLAERRPVVLVSGHLGSWEALLALAPRLGMRPFYGVSRPPENRPLSLYAQRMRERWGVRLLHRHGAVRSIVQALGAGASVGMLIDQRARRKTVLAPFFGRLAHCERAVPVLLQRARVPVLVGGCAMLGEPFRYKAEISRVLWPEEFAGAAPERVLAGLHAELERMILAQPEQYLWLHDRYRKAPPPGAEAPRTDTAGAGSPDPGDEGD